MKVGIDLLEIERINSSKKFLNKILTEKEQEYVEKFENKKEKICGLFCAKEAIFKALDLKNFKPKLIEISHGASGRPLVNLSGEYLEHFNSNYKKIDISITHNKTLAQAICLIEEK